MKTSPPPGFVPAVTGSCTTSQFKCSDGNGCCNNGAVCTSFSSSAYCSTATGGPTSTLIAGSDGGSSSSGGLSAGAEAGIAVGSVVGGGLIVAAAVWYFLRRRRSTQPTNHVYGVAELQPDDVHRDAATAPSGPTMSTAPATPRTWRQRWTMASSLTPSGAVTDAGTIRSPSSAPDPVEIGSEALSEVAGSEVMTPKSERTGFDLRTPETIDGRFELGGTEMSWPQPSPASPEPSPQPQEPSRNSKSS